jgi:hypothetical protein
VGAVEEKCFWKSFLIAWITMTSSAAAAASIEIRGGRWRKGDFYLSLPSTFWVGHEKFESASLFWASGKHPSNFRAISCSRDTYQGHPPYH